VIDRGIDDGFDPPPWLIVCLIVVPSLLALCCFVGCVVIGCLSMGRLQAERTSNSRLQAQLTRLEHDMRARAPAIRVLGSPSTSRLAGKVRREERQGLIFQANKNLQGEGEGEQNEEEAVGLPQRTVEDHVEMIAAGETMK